MPAPRPTLFPYTTLFRSARNSDPREPAKYSVQGGQLLGCSAAGGARSEEHTSELQSLAYLVCRLLLEKKKTRSRRSSGVSVRISQEPGREDEKATAGPRRRDDSEPHRTLV